MKSISCTAGALLAAALLSGCSLPGGGKPAQTYRFGVPAAVAAAPSASGVVVQLNGLDFQAAAEGDRILAVNGAQTFYIAQSRWVSPARELFTEAADRAFERAGMNLIRRGQPQPARANLNLTVPVFEARYLNGVQAAPTVVVEIEAALASTTGERGPLGSTRTSASIPAASNNVTSIVAAYEAASAQALDQVAAWAATTAGRAPAA
jgi:cholesterol transport system auxiliary component